MSYAQAIEIPGAPIAEDPDEWLFNPEQPFAHVTRSHDTATGPLFKATPTGLALHHRVMLNAIQECIETPFGRLMIFAPPGSAKSTYTSVVAPTWAMGKYAGFKVVSTSYAQGPAYRSARRAQQIVRSAMYQAIWEHKAMPVRGTMPVEEWTLSNDATMLSAGLLHGITSARADLGIIDDPVSGREDADSQALQKKIAEAYQDDFLTRLKPNASIILMMTRWQENDLAGSILPIDWNGESGDIECRDGQTWRVLCIQAENERTDDPLGRPIGGMLWPEWFTERHWAIYRSNPRTWGSLYQQRPVPDTGGQVEKKHFKRYNERPKNVTWVLSTDFATPKLETSTQPDYTEHVIGGFNSDTELFFDDGWSGQETTDKQLDAALDLIRRYKPGEWLIETGGLFNMVTPQANRAMIDSVKAVDNEGRKKGRAMATIVKMPSSADKVAKFQTVRGMAHAGQVWVRAGSWGDRFIAQLCAFPFGRYDDMADAAGQIARRMDETFAAAPPPTPEEKRKARQARNARPFTPQDIFDREDAELEERKRRFLEG